MKRALLVLVLSACGGSSAMRAAERGDLATLRADITASEKVGKLSNRDAADLARVVAAREVGRAPPAEALLRVREVRACAYEVDDSLALRMKNKDAAGAEAASVRLEDGQLDPSDARSFLQSTSDAWRAVGARALTRKEDHAARVHALLDPSPEVRRGAIRACIAAADPADLDVVFEAARVDPEPLVRTDAVRAIPLLVPAGPPAGPASAGGAGSDVANRLRDLWTGGDDALREDIAAAWATPPVWGAGGREALRVLIAAGEGPGVLAAAGAVLRAPHIRDPEIAGSARALLARTIESSSRRNRLHALAVAPIAKQDTTSPLFLAMRKAATDEDMDVRLSALARLVERTDRAEAVKALEAFAGQKDRPLLASRARLALASAGDIHIQAWIEEDLGSDDARVRLSAVDALAALGRAARGAPLLADKDPSVRTRTACALLLSARAAH